MTVRMDPELARELGSLAKLSERRIYHILKSETPRRYDLTKAIVNVLFNLCEVQSIETDEKDVIEKYVHVIPALLSKKTSLAAKKTVLLANVPLVVALAKTCLQNA